MFKYRVRKNPLKSVYSMILLSYFAMILTFIVTGVILMHQSDVALTAEIIAANQASMHQMQSLIDDELRSVERLCYEQSLDATLNGLIYTQRREGALPETKRRLSVVDVVQNLYTASVANHTADVLYLLTVYDQEVLTQNGKFTLDEFFQRYYGNQNEITREDFLLLNVETEYDKYITLPSTQPDLRSILYLYALPVGAREKLAVMRARIDTATLRGMMKSGEWLPDSEVVMLDQAGNTIVSSGGTDSIVKQIPWDTVEDGQPIHLKVNQDRYTVMVSSSQTSPFRFGIVVPSNIFLLSQKTHLQSYMWGLTLMLVVSIATAILMANVQYRPIRHLTDIVLPPTDSGDSQLNEYRLIEHSISSIKSENTVLSHANEKQQELLRSQRLISILHGMPSDEYEIQDILRNSGMSMQYGKYVFVLISLDSGKCNSTDDRKASECKPISHENKNVMAASASNGDLEFPLPSDIDLLTMFNRQMWYLLLNIPEQKNEREIHQCCQEWWRRHENDGCFISIGKCFRELSEIHQEFLLVSELREYQLVNGKEPIIQSDSMPREELPLQPDSTSDHEKIDKKVIVTEAIALIQARYSDQALSVTAIADEFGISQVALTRAFKYVLDVGVLDFIHKTRLDIAKQLIANTRANLLDIAQQVGYTNNVTFIRVFKKYEGVTPSQYRMTSQSPPNKQENA